MITTTGMVKVLQNESNAFKLLFKKCINANGKRGSNQPSTLIRDKQA